jgi:hypothetical protein
MPDSEDRFDSAHILVEVKMRLSDGALWTSHRAATPGDSARLDSWPSYGLNQVAHGLMIEACRREAYMIAALAESNGQPVTQESIREGLSLMLHRFSERFGEGIAQEALGKVLAARDKKG